MFCNVIIPLLQHSVQGACGRPAGVAATAAAAAAARDDCRDPKRGRLVISTAQVCTAIQYEEWDMILVQQQYLSDSDYLGDVESAGYCLLCSECREADGDERWFLDRMGLVCSYCNL